MLYILSLFVTCVINRIRLENEPLSQSQAEFSGILAVYSGAKEQ